MARFERSAKSWPREEASSGGEGLSYQNSRLRNFSDVGDRHHQTFLRFGGNSNFPRNSDLSEGRKKKGKRVSSWGLFSLLNPFVSFSHVSCFSSRFCFSILMRFSCTKQ